MEDEAHCSAYSFVDVEELKIGRCYVAPLPLRPEREVRLSNTFLSPTSLREVTPLRVRRGDQLRIFFVHVVPNSAIAPC